MTEIAKNNTTITLINVSIAAPEKQQQLADTLVEATEGVIDKLPGFIWRQRP